MMIKTKPWRGGKDEEYETQHFGFGAQRLKIAIRQMVEEKVTVAVKQMESYLQTSLNLNEKDQETLTCSCDKLVRLYCERATPSLDIIDSEIERIITIPADTLLPEDEVQINQISDADYEKLKNEVSCLRQRVERGALLTNLLSTEEEELNSLDKVYEIAKKDLEVLDLCLKSTDHGENIQGIEHDTLRLCSSTSFMKDTFEVNILGD